MIGLVVLIAAAIVAAQKTDSEVLEDVTLSYAEPTNLADNLLTNPNFINPLNDFIRQEIPERSVHAKGTGAYGYFKLTADLKNITKADFLNGVGKETPVLVRFSTGTGERGSSDQLRDTRGWSMKLYTNEGNCDFVGFNTEMYLYKNPNSANTIVHGVKRQPGTGLHSLNAYWDAVTTLPETLNLFIRAFSPKGIPADYRHMNGSMIHTFPFVNIYGLITYVRMHFIARYGNHTLPTMKAMTLAATEPDYSIRVLHESIEKGEDLRWDAYLQIMTEADVEKHGKKLFDVTRLIPAEEFPHVKFGEIVLNKNADDFLEEIEKAAFSPANLVPGIDEPLDKIFEARSLIYKDTQYHRLGKNHNLLPVNCPLQHIYTYNRDGNAPLGDNGGDVVSYYPNSFNGPLPYMDTPHKVLKIIETDADNTDQVIDFYTKELDEAGRQTTVDNLAMPLRLVDPNIRLKAIKMFTKVHPDLGRRLAVALNNTSSN